MSVNKIGYSVFKSRKYLWVAGRKKKNNLDNVIEIYNRDYKENISDLGNGFFWKIIV